MADNTPDVLDAVELTYAYRRTHPILDGLTLGVPAGRMTAITGPSGTGKSTLLYLLAGLLTPLSGHVSYDGQNQTRLSDLGRARVRSQNFGFVFQDFALDPRRSVLEAVLEPCLYATRPRKDLLGRAGELLDQMGVWELADSLPGQMSGGQAQRVAVCRALLLSPRVVFADEPTGNLDNASADAVLRALQGAADGGAAVLIATHDDRVVERCGKRVRL